MEETKITWKTFMKDIDTLCKMLEKERFVKILVIAKGGMIPAYFIAKKFNIQFIETLCISSYNKDHTRKGDEDVFAIPLSKEVDTRKGWLIIDDLVDSGESIKIAKKYYPHSKVATLYTKSYSPPPDYFVSVKKNWVKFPWED